MTRLLFITQKLHEQDAFTELWVKALIARGFSVDVVCLENRRGDLAFPVHSLGKERGHGKLRQIIAFYRHILTLPYDRVFIHMSPVWGMLGAPVFMVRRTPTYLWYTHYKKSLSLRVTATYARRMFCATSQSLPQYEGDARKVVVGHGIDLAAWPRRDNASTDPLRLLAVHRLSRSKRLELSIRALKLLPGATLDVYGIEAEPEYVQEMRELVSSLGLGDRVAFHGTVPMSELSAIYARHRFLLNMASETIDKTMLECMTCGCYPVTTMRNAEAIGISAAIAEDTPEAIARFVTDHRERAPLSPEEMYEVVQSRHSLPGLVERMSAYVKEGN